MTAIDLLTRTLYSTSSSLPPVVDVGFDDIVSLRLINGLFHEGANAYFLTENLHKQLQQHNNCCIVTLSTVSDAEKNTLHSTANMCFLILYK